MHSYFSPEELLRDQEKSLEIPLGLLSIGTYLKENFPDQTEISILHLDYEEFKERNHSLTQGDSISQKSSDYFRGKVREKLKKFDPDIVGIGFLTIQTSITKQFLEIIRSVKNDLVIIAGGPHITFYNEDFLDLKEPNTELPLLDLISLGEGEYSIEGVTRALLFGFDRKKLLADLQDGSYSMPRNCSSGRDKSDRKIQVRTRATDLFPVDFEILDEDYPDRFINNSNAIMQTKRGCLNACAFCISKNFFPERGSSREVTRPLEYIEEELLVFLRCNIVSVEILDERFDPDPSDKNIQFRLCKLLAGSRFEGMHFTIQTRADTVNDLKFIAMKAARITTILIGAESASDKVLNLMCKGLRFSTVEQAVKNAKDWGFKVGVFWILGFPGSTLEDDKTSIGYIQSWTEKALVDYHEVNYFIPYPGTDFFPDNWNKTHFRGLQIRLLKKSSFYEDWVRFGKLGDRHEGPVLETKEYRAEELKTLFAELLDWANEKGYQHVVNPASLPSPSVSVTRVKAAMEATKVSSKMSNLFEEMISQKQQHNDHEIDFKSSAGYVLSYIINSKDNGPTGLMKIILNCFDNINKLLIQTKIRIDSVFIFPYIYTEEKSDSLQFLNETSSLPYPLVMFNKSIRDWNGSNWDRIDFSQNSFEEKKMGTKKYYLYNYSIFEKSPIIESGVVVRNKKRQAFFHRLNQIPNALIVENQNIRKIRKEKSGDQKDDDCQGRWAVGIGFSFPNQIHIKEIISEEVENDCIHKLDSSGIALVLNDIIIRLFSQLAGLLEVELQSILHEQELAYRLGHMQHDMKNLFSSAQMLSTVSIQLNSRKKFAEKLDDKSARKYFYSYLDYLQTGIFDFEGTDKLE